MKKIVTLIYVGLALICFAANSIICRLALATGSINAMEFTTIRLLSGVLILTIIKGTGESRKQEYQLRDMVSAGALFLYMVSFSFAYVNLKASTGTLLLFGAVQMAMILAGFTQGIKIKYIEIAGLLVAFSGLFYLLIPGWEIPTLKGGILMIIAGASWGIYSILGRNANNPILETRKNFTYAIPFALLVTILSRGNPNITLIGSIYAIISGAITSGLGYVVWYKALPNITVTQAATIQLLVPIITALGGVMFLSEIISLRFIISSFMILGGVGVCFLIRKE